MKKYIFYLLIITGLISCEDLIETDYPSSQIGTAQVFNDFQTANSALNNLYAEIRNLSFFSGTDTGLGILLGSYSDDLNCYYDDQNGYRDIFLNQQQPTNSIVEMSWDTPYKMIFAANAIIYGVENSTELEQADISQLKGEALVIRSLFYFHLQQLFGDIPYTTSIDYEYNRNLDKTDSDQILMNLVSDLIQAAELLTDDYRNAERLYLNKKVAELLLAKVYLTQGNYILAEQTVSLVLQSSMYQFESDLNSVFDKSGMHILWQIQPLADSFPTWESLFFYFNDAPPHAFALTNDLVNSFEQEDARKATWIKAVTVGDQTWYRADKYKNIDVNQNEYSIIFRIEEANFIMAEALGRQNRINEALNYLNLTRVRAGLQPLENLSAEVFFEELLSEKRREFFTEFGHRFFDLKRLEKLNELASTKPNWSDYKKVWPIPQKELLLNPNLSPQNEGY